MVGIEGAKRLLSWKLRISFRTGLMKRVDYIKSRGGV